MLPRFSFLCRPGVIKPPIWQSHTGEERTTPARAPTLSRRINISNGWVAKSRHSPLGVNDARCSAGNEQYGPRKISPKGANPKGDDWYQIKPSTVPTASASKETTMRRLNSLRCSTRVISPVLFALLARRFACDCWSRWITPRLPAFAGTGFPEAAEFMPEFCGGMPLAIIYLSPTQT